MAMKNLIERGAPINFVGKDVSGKVRISESPLGIVCQKGNSGESIDSIFVTAHFLNYFVGLVTLLLQKGADVHLKDSLGQTVLHYVLILFFFFLPFFFSFFFWEKGLFFEKFDSTRNCSTIGECWSKHFGKRFIQPNTFVTGPITGNGSSVSRCR